MMLIRIGNSQRWVALVTAVLALASVSLAAAPGDERLLQLVKDRDAAAVRAALAGDTADANAAEIDGTTALHWAAHLDDLETVDALIAAGADATTENRYGVTPLSLASINGNAVIIGRLLRAGADASWASREGQTALMTAARTGNVDAVEVLLASGADVNATETRRGQTALMWTAAERHAGASEALLRHGADVRARSDGGLTPLLFAARAGDFDVVRTLLVVGADIDELDDDGNTAMILAILNGHYSLAAFLAERGANPDLGGPGGTALHHAVRWRNYELTDFYRPAPPQTGNLDPFGLIERLLASGADPNARMTERVARGGVFDNNWVSLPLVGATPLLIAARAGDAAAIRLLVANGADPHLGTDKCVTPLMAAAGMGFNFERSIGSEAERLEVVELLWEFGDADLHAVNDKGATAMHAAARSGTTAVVKFLYEHGAPIGLETDDGWTPLKNSDGTRSHFSHRPETAALIRELQAAEEAP